MTDIQPHICSATQTANAALHNEASQHQYDALSCHPANRQKPINSQRGLTHLECSQRCLETAPPSPSCSCTEDLDKESSRLAAAWAALRVQQAEGQHMGSAGHSV